jgi:urease accessory protein
VALRLLGLTSLGVKKAVHLAWNTARLMLIGVPAPDLRKG